MSEKRSGGLVNFSINDDDSQYSNSSWNMSLCKNTHRNLRNSFPSRQTMTFSVVSFRVTCKGLTVIILLMK